MSTSEKSPAHEAAKSRPGHKTSEGWLTVFAMALPWVVENLPPTWKVVVTAVSAGVYTVARAIVKR